MILQQQIKDDLKVSMKAKTGARTSAIRVLMGEFGRQPDKELSDDKVIAIVRKLIKSEKETLSKSGTATSDYLEVLDGYMPSMPTEDEIKEWISANLDFSKFNNKMQAMKPIMANYGGMVDGNIVKKILETM